MSVGADCDVELSALHGSRIGNYSCAGRATQLLQERYVLQFSAVLYDFNSSRTVLCVFLSDIPCVQYAISVMTNLKLVNCQHAPYCVDIFYCKFVLLAKDEVFDAIRS